MTMTMHATSRRLPLLLRKKETMITMMMMMMKKMKTVVIGISVLLLYGHCHLYYDYHHMMMTVQTTDSSRSSSGRNSNNMVMHRTLAQSVTNHHPPSREQQKKQQQQQQGQQQQKHQPPRGILPRILVFVFPQFHNDPLNDRLWGNGFTDWDSLRGAPTHNRLGLPIPRPMKSSSEGGMGYYNYTQLEPRRWHGRLAQQYGIDGYVFHHYWFYDDDDNDENFSTKPTSGNGGGPNLHAPLEEMLKDGQPNTPFALHWCASTWITTWNAKPIIDTTTTASHGNASSSSSSRDSDSDSDTTTTTNNNNNNVLQQQYFPTDPDDPRILQHYRWLSRFFKHPNYIRVHGRPLLMMYRRDKESFLVLEKFQQFAKEDGFDEGLYLTVGLQKPHHHLMLPHINWDLEQDSNIEQFVGTNAEQVFDKAVTYPNPFSWSQNRTMVIPQRRCFKKQWNRTKEITGIMTSFDNTPRRDFHKVRIWSNSDPNTTIEKFRQSLEATLEYETCCFQDTYEKVTQKPPAVEWDQQHQEKSSQMRRRQRQLNQETNTISTSRDVSKSATASVVDGDDRIVIVNAMNEWAEGMVLEPSDVYGTRFLETIRDVKQSVLLGQCQKWNNRKKKRRGHRQTTQ